jgi:hypothetical protein
MGWYEDHSKAVAKRQAKKLIAGETEDSVREYLAECYWKPQEIDYIMQHAKRYAEREK